MQALLKETGGGETSFTREAVAFTSALVIVNRRAGRVLQMGRARFEAAVVAAFAAQGVEARVTFHRAGSLSEALQNAIASPVGLVVLAGGDGTISHALEVLVAAKRPCAILPLGTLNLLGRDLGLKGTLEADIAALAHGQARRISLARVNGRLFHTNAGFGLLSVMARERENARRDFPFSRAISFALAAIKTLLTYRPIEVNIDQGGQTRVFDADTVLVTSNRFDGMPWQRARLDEGVLEIHLLGAGGLSSRLRLLLLMARGRWREHPLLTSFQAQRFTISRRRKNSIALSIDGEACRMHGPVTFDVAPEELILHA